MKLVQVEAEVYQRCLSIMEAYIWSILGRQLQTVNGKNFLVVDFKGNEVYIVTNYGKQRKIHFDHLSRCYQWLYDFRRQILGVSSNNISVRGLIGKKGVFLKCSTCDKNAPYIWGILAMAPSVKRTKNILFV